MSVCNKFLKHKISFWKQKKWIYVIFFCALIELQSCDLVVCVALELCSKFLQIWILLRMFLKGIVHQLLKWGALKCNHVRVRNSSAYNFFFVKLGSKNVKTVCQRWFFSKLIWFIQSGFFFIGFFCLFVRPCRTVMLFEVLVLILLASLFD